MHFSNYKDCLDHPSARHIPLIILMNTSLLFHRSHGVACGCTANDFDIFIPDDFLEIMQTSRESILSRLDRLLPSLQLDDSNLQKRSLWLVIVLSHPELSFLTIKKISKKLRLSTLDVIELATLWGNKNYFIGLLEDYFKQNFLIKFQFISHLFKNRQNEWFKQQSYKIFLILIEHGYFEIFKYFVEVFPTHMNQFINKSADLIMILSISQGDLLFKGYVLKQARTYRKPQV